MISIRAMRCTRKYVNFYIVLYKFIWTTVSLSTCLQPRYLRYYNHVYFSQTHVGHVSIENISLINVPSQIVRHAMCAN